MVPAKVVPCPLCVRPDTASAFHLSRFIKKTGRYAVFSALGLCLPVFSVYLASTWKPSTPEWVYWLTVFPSGLGYSSFLCCSLGETEKIHPARDRR